MYKENSERAKKKGHRDRYVVRFWTAYYYRYKKGVLPDDSLSS